MFLGVKAAHGHEVHCCSRKRALHLLHWLSLLMAGRCSAHVHPIAEPYFTDGVGARTCIWSLTASSSALFWRSLLRKKVLSMT